ncbi:DinB family protein [Daejeonella oryzae]|uniref:DinB family protein n=1 Tax=Daejeonella oryzae TaxID=1122943 RepID=UPI0003FD5D12|nr:DinB family protein [Daejeonella oryzae]
MKLPEATKSRMVNQTQVIENLIEGLTNEDLNLKLYEGKWSIHQHLAHLSSYNYIFLNRIETIMGTFNAKFDSYQAESDPAFLLACQMSARNLLDYLKEGRQKLREILFSLDSGELSRAGFHPKYGNLSIIMWTELFLLHEAHHIYSILRMSNQIKSA